MAVLTQSFHQVNAFMKLGASILSIADEGLVSCRFKEAINESVLVNRTASARLPTEYGEFQVFSYVSNDGLEHAAIVEVCFLYLLLFYSIYESINTTRCHCSLYWWCIILVVWFKMGGFRGLQRC